MDIYPEIKKPSGRDWPNKAGRAIRRGARWLLRRLPIAGAFFLLSLAQLFSVPSPYAICCLASALRCGMDAAGAGMGLIAGLGFRLLWGLDLDIWQFAACLICLPMCRLPWKKNGWFFTAVGGLLLFRALPGMMAAADAQAVIMNAAGIMLGIASMPALTRAGKLIKDGIKEIGEDDLLCLALPCLLLITGAGRLSLFQVNFGVFLAALATLIFAWTAGTGAGVLCGLGCGLALLLGGQSALPLVNLVLGGLMAGLTQGKTRLMSAALYLLATVTDTYLIAFSFQLALFFGDAAAGLAFCLIPGRYMRAFQRFLRRARWSQPRENAYTRLKMQRWVRSIDRMAAALPTPKIEETTPEEVGEALTEMLCPECERMLACWRDDYEGTKTGMAALARCSGAGEDQLEIINRYFSQCPRISRLPGLMRRVDEDRQKKVQRAVCAEYERDMLQTHLTALSQAAQKISLEGAADGDEAYWTAQVEEVLSMSRFPGKTAFIKRIDGRFSVGLKCDTLFLHPGPDEQLARQVGRALRAKLRVTENKGGKILMEEIPPLLLSAGTATACAVTPERKRQAGSPLDNGDAVLIKTMDGGKQLIALSDGMGHGTGAQEESMKTLEMLSLCLEAGYSRAQAMTAVNGAMLSATGGEKFATVDLCLVDLWTGEATLNKLGACASFLIRGQKIETIEGTALPLGIIERVTPMEHSFTLGEGDMLLIMTDGISDAFSDEEDILNILRRDRKNAPQQIADTLLQEAMIQYGGMPEDDMTVVCAKAQANPADR